MKNNLVDFKDDTGISTSYPSTIINILKFKNKNLCHLLIMANKKIGELRTRIFVNKSLLEGIKLEKMELEFFFV
jgi:hypothetical protein